MTSIFWFALVLGGGLLGVSLLGDVLEGADLDVDTEADAGVGGATHSVFEAFSVRNLTYFLFGFGATGVLLGWLDVGVPLALITSAAVGVVAATVSALTFRWLRATESGQFLTDETFEGTTGRVVLPMRDGAPGLVVVQRGGREYELRAEPLDRDRPEAADWSEVIVVEMKEGTARVLPMEDPLLTGE